MRDQDLRDFFASQAMSIVMGETKEMRPASFVDWLKLLAIDFFHMHFLSVNFTVIEGVYKDAADRSYQYADAMMAAREKENTNG